MGNLFYTIIFHVFLLIFCSVLVIDHSLLLLLTYPDGGETLGLLLALSNKW